jgi:hypothetical protein
VAILFKIYPDYESEVGMKKLLLSVCLVVFALCGCATPQTQPDRTMSARCSLPSGYDLSQAVSVADSTLRDCPHMLRDVLDALITVAGHNPSIENRRMIGDLFQNLSDAYKISKKDAQNLWGLYFETELASFPNVRGRDVTNLVVEKAKKDMAAELNLKKKALLLACKDEARWQKTLESYNRAVNFLEIYAFIMAPDEYAQGGPW